MKMDRADWEAGMKEFAAATHGVIEMMIVDRVKFMEVVATALMTGDPKCRVIMNIMRDALPRTMGTKARKGKGLLCVACDHEFHRGHAMPGAFMVWLPGIAEAAPVGMVSPICEKCHWTKDEDRLLADTLVYARKIWPDLRVASSTGGHA